MSSVGILTMGIGDKVRKVRGYDFPGEIRSVFTTKACQVRYVVECTEPGVKGMLHIFNGDQLELVEACG